VYFSNILIASDINNIKCTISATKYRISSIPEFESKVGWECSEAEEIRNVVESFSHCLTQLESVVMSLIKMLHLIVHYLRIR
jgi:hypothetical protein